MCVSADLGRCDEWKIVHVFMLTFIFYCDFYVYSCCLMMLPQLHRLHSFDRSNAVTTGKDEIILGIRSWWSTAMNREEWRQLLREAKSLTEL
jgi:hypothetical protein